jgi:peptidoglycan/xylan/chitin deacetylase (PgdA/CDA1 family)
MKTPILMYHEMAPVAAPDFAKYTVSPDAFRRQVRWLSRAGYQTLPLDDLAGARRSVPSKAVAITFDDGFASCVEHALPVLKDRAFTATFYLVAGLIGGRSEWLAAERGFDLPMVDWAAVRALAAGGFQCGSHSTTHPHLDRAEAERCRWELTEARRILEAGIGGPVVHLAYPFGGFNSHVRAIAAEAGYVTATTVEPRLSHPWEDPLALPRVPITGSCSLVDFISLVRSGQTVRQRLHSLRQRLSRQT